MSDSTFSLTSSEDEACSFRVLPGRRSSRKSGYSNIFSGINIHQLQRLFQTAGDSDAEQRGRLVWRGAQNDEDDDDEDSVVKAESTEAALAQALVGLRICARTKAGFRAEAYRKCPPSTQRVKGSIQ
uniref:Arginine vasopressin-induced protein 1 n=1 Tax=Knipowitschia caucasica TaxID=637954 RepID=A0AAV2LHK6_KNICA